MYMYYCDTVTIEDYCDTIVLLLSETYMLVKG